MVQLSHEQKAKCWTFLRHCEGLNWAKGTIHYKMVWSAYKRKEREGKPWKDGRKKAHMIWLALYVTRTWICTRMADKIKWKVIEVLSVYLFWDYEIILKCCENWNETSTPFNAMWISSYKWSKVAWLI